MHPTFPPYVKTFETDPDNLRAAVIEDLIFVASGWNLDPTQEQPAEQDPNFLGVGGGHRGGFVDVLELLKTTTRAVRAVRNYLVSLPDDSSVPQTKPHFRPQTLSSAPLPKRQVSQPNSPHDPLTRIRGRALEVLAVLRELEERARLPLDHDAYDAQSDHGSSNDTAPGPVSRGTSPSSQLEEPEFLDADTPVSISYVDVGGRQRQVPVWDDENSDFNSLSEVEREKRERWDERLVLGGGWLYQQDVKMEDLAREREVIGKYLEAVDDVLFGGPKEGKRGWEREKERMERKERMDREARAKGRRVSAGDAMNGSGESSGRSKRRVVSTGMLDAMRSMVVTEESEEMDSIDEEEAVDDDDLPPWAKRSTFQDDDYGMSFLRLFRCCIDGTARSPLRPPGCSVTSGAATTTAHVLLGPRRDPPCAIVRPDSVQRVQYWRSTITAAVGLREQRRHPRHRRARRVASRRGLRGWQARLDIQTHRQLASMGSVRTLLIPIDLSSIV